MYKILINIITKNKDKWIFYQEDGADYVASSLDDIKDKALELLDEYGEDNVKIVDQRSGDDGKKDIPTYLFGNGTSGTSDYNELENKPKINGVELINNKSLKDLGIIIPLNEDFTLEGLGEKSYNSLDDKPKIPKKVSELENDSKYETVENTDTKIAGAKSYADEAIAHLVGSAPETLDTLEEVAKAIQDNETVVDALNAAIGSKADKTELETKQDKLTAGSNITIDDNVISAADDAIPTYILQTSVRPSAGAQFTDVYNELGKIINDNPGKTVHLCLFVPQNGMYMAQAYYGTVVCPDVRTSTAVSSTDGTFMTMSQKRARIVLRLELNIDKTVTPYKAIVKKFSCDEGSEEYAMSGDVSDVENRTMEMVMMMLEDSNNNFLAKTNTTEYAPSDDYNPATKKYVDDSIKNMEIPIDITKVPIYNLEVSNLTSLVVSEGTSINFTSEEKEKVISIVEDIVSKQYDIFYINVTNSNHSVNLLFQPTDYSTNYKTSRLMMDSVFSRYDGNNGYIRHAELFVSFKQDESENITGVQRGVITLHNADYLSKTNTATYTPTGDYNPATKKYVDDNTGIQTITENFTITDKADGVYWVKSGVTATIPNNGDAPTFDMPTLVTIATTQDGGKYIWYDINGYYRSLSTYGESYLFNLSDLLSKPSYSDVITKYNENEYSPTGDYNPATKKYVDDQIGSINTVLATLTTVTEESDT